MRGKKRATFLALAAAAFLVADLLVGTLRLGNESRPVPGSAKPGLGTKPSLGNVRTLLAAYKRWKNTYSRDGEDPRLILGLSYSKGLSAQFTTAHGQATLDLVDGSLSVGVSGLSDRETYDVWLIDNRPGPGRSVKPERDDGMVRVGSLKHEGGTATLQARLDREALPGFEIDLVVVARSGEAPGAAGLLFGSPSFFQRLYYSEQQGQFSRLAQAASPRRRESSIRSLLSAPFRVFIPSIAFADPTGSTTGLEALVAEGERLFFNETFKGNGRTCGTCHPAQNNLTLDPKFIATLPRNDPLFVAETNPDLAVNFENPTLMREFGLILENVDGFDDLDKKFVMRGVPHTLALSTSRDPAPPVNPNSPQGPLFDGTFLPPNERTGWGGDGAAGRGTLRDFATGAVIQHFTKTLNRKEGEDFRLPTDDELDAMAAFQLSLGRQADDSNLRTLKFKSRLVTQGQELFFGEDACNFCHGNAGASALIPISAEVTITGNFNFNTGVEDFPHPAGKGSPVQPRPRDGGFGRTPNGDGKGGFGDGTFSTPPLVEAADTGPFFHNNAVETIEEAVAFYGTAAFNDSPAGILLRNLEPPLGPIEVDDDEARAIGAFLRAINALENIRSSIALLERGLEAGSLGKTREVLRLSIAELNDAIAVLRGANQHPVSVQYLGIARALVHIASLIPFFHTRDIYIRFAIFVEKLARELIVEG